MSQSWFTPERHDPLKAKKLSFVEDWEQWQKLWHAHTEVSLLTGLLHEGFCVKCDDPVARAKFYLRVADGHTSYQYYENAVRDRLKKPDAHTLEEYRRRVIRLKAFKVLGLNLFDGSRSVYTDAPYWVWIAESMDLLEEILWFFRLDQKVQKFENLRVEWAEKEPPTKKAVSFLRSLSRQALDVRDRYARENISRKAHDNLRAIRAKLVPVLHGLGRHDMLVLSAVGTLPQVMLPLMRIAQQMEWKGRFGGEHKPADLHEAIAFGSPPALTLVQLSAMRKAQKNDREQQRMLKFA